MEAGLRLLPAYKRGYALFTKISRLNRSSFEHAIPQNWTGPTSSVVDPRYVRRTSAHPSPVAPALCRRPDLSRVTARAERQYLAALGRRIVGIAVAGGHHPLSGSGPGAQGAA